MIIPERPTVAFLLRELVNQAILLVVAIAAAEADTVAIKTARDGRADDDRAGTFLVLFVSVDCCRGFFTHRRSFPCRVDTQQERMVVVALP